MPKNQILENITIDKLIFWGKWLGVAPDGRKVIITGGCIPGSVVNVRVLKERKSHYEGQELDVVKKSPLEVPLLPGHQLYGGAKWLTIGYEDQLRIKEWQVREAFHHLGEFTSDTIWHPIIASPEVYGYRNKVEFSWGKYISEREGIHDDFRFGFHAQGQFDRIIDCSYCALADEEINSIFHEVDVISRASGFPTYDPKTQVGFYRHFVVRKAHKTGEIMLIFSVNHIYEREYQDFFTEMVRKLTEKFPHIASVYFLENTWRADIVTGNPILLSGKPAITEELLSLTFEIQPKSFFQVNTLGAEKLYTRAIDFIRYKGWVLLDLYAGTGTIGILLSKHFDTVYSVELIESASADGEKNATKNGITNVQFVCKKAEVFAKEWKEANKKADTIVIDPPRDGMHSDTLPSILSFGAKEIIYVSCNPATLARDLEVLVGKTRDEKTEKLSRYRITDVVPVDMFPHTHHIETIVRLELI
jgi:23S rRNA (uracil1939-C5)-methyltransferase